MVGHKMSNVCSPGVIAPILETRGIRLSAATIADKINFWTLIRILREIGYSADLADICYNPVPYCEYALADK